MKEFAENLEKRGQMYIYNYDRNLSERENFNEGVSVVFRENKE